MTSLHEISDAAAEHGLIVMGAFREAAPSTLVLLGTGGPFWEKFQASDEYLDGNPHALDRWSGRVVGALAFGFGASAEFPFGGPPYAPFIDYAKRTGRAWASPVGMLVHDEAGLMISFRGALRFATSLPLPDAPSASPCKACAQAPCLSACPVDALGSTGYDVAACHAFLDTAAGQDCMEHGCKARRACPVSQSFGRDPAQSRFHMAAFHK